MPERFPAGYYNCRFSAEPAPGESFAIVTAWNPMDRLWSGRMNRAADHRLRRLLGRKHLPHTRATSMAPDGTHTEPGWAVACDLPVALHIARRFRQRAIWWVENGTLHLVACDDAHTESLGPFSDRLADQPTNR
jgi:hypothetical protein